MNDMLLEYIDRMIDQETEHRVFSVDFNNKQYFVKQDISNHRSSWIKPDLELLLIMSFTRFLL